MGILGGTFDPIHHGHLRLALEVYEGLDLEAVRLIPLATPPHRTDPTAPAPLRLAMLQAALNNEPGLIADDRELRRKGISYTVDTLSELRQEYGVLPLCLIVGMDAFSALDTWRSWERLIQLAHIAIVHRPEASLPTAGPVRELFEHHKTQDPLDLHRVPAGRIARLAIPLLDISASRIRSLIRAGRNPRYLLPEAVMALIHQHKLYRHTSPHAA